MQAAELRANSTKAEHIAIVQGSAKQVVDFQNAIDKLDEAAADRVMKKLAQAFDAEMHLQIKARSILVRFWSVTLLIVCELRVLKTALCISCRHLDQSTTYADAICQ